MNECHFSVNSMHGTHVKDNEKVVKQEIACIDSVISVDLY